MRLLKTLILALALAAALPARGLAGDELDVVATIPDLAELARAIGGERVEVTALTRGPENLHAFSARPSHLVAMNRADLFLQVGLSLEMSFVPGLLEAARNRAILPGAPGFVNVSEGWEAIGVPAEVSRQAGDVHPQGNPHMNLDPRAGEHMARAVHAALVRADPAGEELFDRRLADWLAKYRDARARWERQAEAFRGGKVATYHLDFDYLARHYDMPVVATIELRPGVPPTPNHLARVIETMRREKAKAILVAPWARNSAVERVAEATGAKLVVPPIMGMARAFTA